MFISLIVWHDHYVLTLATITAHKSNNIIDIVYLHYLHNLAYIMLDNHAQT